MNIWCRPYYNVMYFMKVEAEPMNIWYKPYYNVLYFMKVEAEPMNIWSPRSDPEAGQENAILPIDPTLAMEVHPVS